MKKKSLYISLVSGLVGLVLGALVSDSVQAGIIRVRNLHGAPIQETTRQSTRATEDAGHENLESRGERADVVYPTNTLP